MLKSRLSKFIDAEKIKVVPHAVGDTNVVEANSKLKSLARRSFEFKAMDKVVTVYGYRSWYKGTDWIVKTVSDLSKRYPNQSFKLLVAGGVSPTLKHTDAYKAYDKKLKRVIKSANGSVKVTNFIPENDVWKVFAASDLIVFPYRTRMSASGAFNLALTYKKPFLVSKHFSDGMGIKNKDMIFDLNIFSFEGKLFNLLKNSKLRREISEFCQNTTSGKSWNEVACLYLTEIKSGNILVDGNFKQNYELVEA
jgi:glycosyltransferase involved in cell wall biosynthesis